MTHNLVSRQFISTSKRSNFENCTKSAQSTGPERNRRLGEKNENPAGPWYTGQIRNGRQYWACLLINELGEHASSAIVAERVSAKLVSRDIHHSPIQLQKPLSNKHNSYIAVQRHPL